MLKHSRNNPNQFENFLEWPKARQSFNVNLIMGIRSINNSLIGSLFVEF